MDALSLTGVPEKPLTTSTWTCTSYASYTRNPGPVPDSYPYVIRNRGSCGLGSVLYGCSHYTPNEFGSGS